MSSPLRLVLGFVLCFVIGAGLGLAIELGSSVLELPHSVVADSTLSTGRVVISGLVLAVVCAMLRSVTSRARKEERAAIIDLRSRHAQR